MNNKVIIEASRSHLVSELMYNDGTFKTVTFIKNNGDERTINGRVSKNKPFSNQGYLRLKTSKGNWKLINPRTISSVSARKVLYVLNK